MSFKQLDPIPEGVQVLREYRSLHGHLVQCQHAERHRYNRLGQRICCHVCMADDTMTEDFRLPVKFMAVLPSGQGSLFG